MGNRGFAWQSFCVTGTMKMFCIRKNILSHKKKESIVPAMQHGCPQNVDLYSEIFVRKLAVDEN